jgi:hypothetical protein
MKSNQVHKEKLDNPTFFCHGRPQVAFRQNQGSIFLEKNKTNEEKIPFSNLLECFLTTLVLFYKTRS